MAERKSRAPVLFWLALVALGMASGITFALAFTTPGFWVPPSAALFALLATGVLAAALAVRCWPRDAVKAGEFDHLAVSGG